MKIFLNLDPKVICESTPLNTNYKQLDEIDAIADTISSNMNKDVRIPSEVLNSFYIKDTLNQDIWDGAHLNPKVRTSLIKIALDFYKDLNIPKEAKIKDIIFTGSLANFNWSKFSDIDLHIVIDFNDFDADTQMVEEYFYAQKTIWNQEHDIEIFGFPVELYVQDINAKLVATAVYSVLKDKWIKKPKREEFALDKKAIKDKADKFIYQLRDIRHDYQDKQYQSVVDKVTKLKTKIKQMRNAGLEKGGEFSLENLVFKAIRRTPFMDILDSLKAKSYDKLMSVSEIENPIVEAEKPSQNDINKLLYNNNGFFDFNNAKQFSRQYLGITLKDVIGYGGNGAAYLTSKNTKLKFTYNENEYDFAKRSIGKKNDYMADYYRAEQINDDIFVIEMEYIGALDNKAKEVLRKYFEDLLNKKPVNPNVKSKVDYIKSKIGMWGNDLLNYDNYGIKNGKLATFDPVSEQILDESDILNNTKFKYVRDEDGVNINVYADDKLIANLHMVFMFGDYDYFGGDFSDEEYDEMFPDDKLAMIEWVEVKQKIYRGQGIAKELMKRAIAKAKQQGFNQIYLNASPIGFDGLNLNDLIDFYKSFGFKVIKHQGNNAQMLLSTKSVMDENREKLILKKKRKDLELKLGKRIQDAEWNNYLENGITPNKKPITTLNPEREKELIQRQAELKAKYAQLKAKGRL